MKVEDAHGGMRDYEPQKIVKAAKRAGFDDDDAQRIESRVSNRIWDEITTAKLHSIVHDEMQEIHEGYARRFMLRESIADLDPNFHEFEKYMVKVLRADGVDATWSPRPKPQGACIDHEIDIVAEELGERFIVECKHHYHHHRYTGLDIPMRQWARLDDLKKGDEIGIKDAIEVDRAWVIVNTKLSDHAKEYAECKNVRMTAWDYPGEDALNSLVERNQTYPITMLRPPHHARVEMSKRNILTLQDLLNLDDEEEHDLGLSDETLSDLRRRAREVLE